MAAWDVVAKYFIGANSLEAKADGYSLVISHGPNTTPPQALNMSKAL